MQTCMRSIVTNSEKPSGSPAALLNAEILPSCREQQGESDILGVRHHFKMEESEKLDLFLLPLKSVQPVLGNSLLWEENWKADRVWIFYEVHHPPLSRVYCILCILYTVYCVYCILHTVPYSLLRVYTVFACVPVRGGRIFCVQSLGYWWRKREMIYQKRMEITSQG